MPDLEKDYDCDNIIFKDYKKLNFKFSCAVDLPTSLQHQHLSSTIQTLMCLEISSKTKRAIWEAFFTPSISDALLISEDRGTGSGSPVSAYGGFEMWFGAGKYSEVSEVLVIIE